MMRSGSIFSGAEAHNNLGFALVSKGQIDEGVKEYKTAIRLKPDYPEPNYNLGITLQALGQEDEAVAALNDFIKYAPPQYEKFVDDANKRIRSISLLKRQL